MKNYAQQWPGEQWSSQNCWTRLFSQCIMPSKSLEEEKICWDGDHRSITSVWEMTGSPYLDPKVPAALKESLGRAHCIFAQMEPDFNLQCSRGQRKQGKDMYQPPWKMMDQLFHCSVKHPSKRQLIRYALVINRTSSLALVVLAHMYEYEKRVGGTVDLGQWLSLETRRLPKDKKPTSYHKY